MCHLSRSAQASSPPASPGASGSFSASDPPTTSGQPVMLEQSNFVGQFDEPIVDAPPSPAPSTIMSGPSRPPSPPSSPVGPTDTTDTTAPARLGRRILCTSYRSAYSRTFLASSLSIVSYPETDMTFHWVSRKPAAEFQVAPKVPEVISSNKKNNGVYNSEQRERVSSRRFGMHKTRLHRLLRGEKIAKRKLRRESMNPEEAGHEAIQLDQEDDAEDTDYSRDRSFPSRIRMGDAILYSFHMISQPELFRASWFDLPPSRVETNRHEERGIYLVSEGLAFTAYTFRCLHQWFVDIHARNKHDGLHKIMGVAPAYLLDFRCGNEFDGRLSPLLDFNKANTAAPEHTADLLGDDATGTAVVNGHRHSSGENNKKPILVKKLRSLPKTVEYHHVGNLQWNMALPFGLRLCGNQPNFKEIYMEIQYKRVSGADLALALECGVDLSAFDVLRKLPVGGDSSSSNSRSFRLPVRCLVHRLLDGSSTIYQCYPASPSRSDLAGEVFERRQKSFVYIVRLVAFVPYNKCKGEHQLMASGGWIVPPIEERLCAYEKQHKAKAAVAATASPSSGSGSGSDGGSDGGLVEMDETGLPLPASLPKALPISAQPSRGVGERAFKGPTVCSGIDAEVWTQVADPAQEDVLWMAWKLMSGTTYRGFQEGVGVGIDRLDGLNKSSLAHYAEGNPFQSPSKTAVCHSDLLYRAHLADCMAYPPRYGIRERHERNYR